LRLGDLTLRKRHYQTGLPSLVNYKPCLLPASAADDRDNRPRQLTADKASNPDKTLRVILK
jgi:hypothetical protein